MKFKALYGKYWTAGEKQEYAMVRELEAKDLEDAFMKMQEDIWSPRGEARPILDRLGLKHTSMCVGDVFQDEKGVYHLIELFGFRRVKTLPKKVKRS